MLRPKVFHANEAVLLEHVDVGEFGAAALAAQVGQPVARPRRYTYAIGEGDVVVEEIVEHARGEHAAHAASLEYKGGVGWKMEHYCFFFVQKVRSLAMAKPKQVCCCPCSSHKTFFLLQKVRFLATAKLKQALFCSYGLTKTFFYFNYKVTQTEKK